MDFQVCSGIWFQGGVGIIRMIPVVLVRWLVWRDVMFEKLKCDIPTVVGTEGRVGTFPIFDVNRSDSKLDLEMLNPKPKTLSPKPQTINPKP